MDAFMLKCPQSEPEKACFFPAVFWIRLKKSLVVPSLVRDKGNKMRQRKVKLRTNESG